MQAGSVAPLLPRSFLSGRQRSRGLWLAAPLLALLSALGGCAPPANTFAPYCPAPRRLTDASQITQYRPGATSHDITDMVVHGEITDLSGTCKDGDQPNTVAVDAAITFRFTRGPAMRASQTDVPYLLTVALGDQIRDQGAYRIHVTFPSNIDTVTLVTDPVHMVFPIHGKLTAASYTIWAAFQLTPDQLAHNRQMGQH